MFKAISNLLGKKTPQQEQAVLIHLDGVGLEDSVYKQYDTSTLEDRLADALGSAGEVDGSEARPTETVLFLYGSDAEAMFKRIEPVLTDYPLCKNSRVVIRQGAVGAPQREVQF